MMVNFDGTAANPLAANVTGISPKGEVVYAGNGTTTVGNPYYQQVGSARSASAYQLNSKTVVRAGYGIFWAPQFALGSPDRDGGLQPDHHLHRVHRQQQTPGRLAVESLPERHPAAGRQHARGPRPASGRASRWWIRTPNRPTSSSTPSTFSASFRSASRPRSAMSGRDRRHLIAGRGQHQRQRARSAVCCRLGSALTQSVANPFFGHGGTGVIGTANVQESQLLLPYPTYGAINATIQRQQQGQVRFAGVQGAEELVSTA